ncbi:hypothetical protein RI065_04125 [Mycoplasmatota bacterium zrk1]
MKGKFDWNNMFFYTMLIIIVYAVTSNDNIPAKIPLDKVEKVMIYDYYTDYRNPIIYEYTGDEINQLTIFISELRFPFLIKSKTDLGFLSKYRIDLYIGDDFPLVFEEDNGFLRYENDNKKIKKYYYARYDKGFIGDFLDNHIN